jgi:hypothetical protein
VPLREIGIAVWEIPIANLSSKKTDNPLNQKKNDNKNGRANQQAEKQQRHLGKLRANRENRFAFVASDFPPPSSIQEQDSEKTTGKKSRPAK